MARFTTVAVVNRAENAGGATRSVLRNAGFAAVLLLAGCGGAASNAAQAPGTPSSSPVPGRADAFSIRPVLASSAPPCTGGPSGMVPAGRDGKVESCVQLGEPVVTGDDVVSATIEPNEPVAVAISLTTAGLGRLNAFLAAHFGDQLGIVAVGETVAAPIRSASIDGPFQIGGLTLAEARRLVGELGGDASVVPATTEFDPAFARATAVCANHRPPPVAAGATSPIVIPHTAGEITALAKRVLGHALPPWDALPADHLVAGCAYLPPGGLAPPVGPETVCPNGDTVVLNPITSQYLVDEDGRWTVDAFASAAAGAPHC